MRPTAATGCLVLFLLPFAGVGLTTAVVAVRSAAEGDLPNAGFLSIFALVFGGIGIGGIIGAVRGGRSLAERAARETEHPDSPWLWRPDWAAGRIEDGSRGAVWAAWIFAALWNLVSLPGAFLALRAALSGGEKVALIALVFPLVGLGLLTWAVRATLRHRRYGVSVLELRSVPAAIGGSLAGTVRTTALVTPSDGFRVRLLCIRRVTRGSGKNRSTSEKILWEEELRVTGQPSRTARGMETAVPFSFAIPSDAEPCDASSPRDRVLWRLRASASVPGIDYETGFEVPVFRTAVTETAPAVEAGPPAASAVPADYRQPPDSRIRVTSNRRGTEILFPPARNPGVAAGLTAFFVVWAGAIAFMTAVGAPIFFVAVFGAIGALVLWGVLELWLRVTSVKAEGGAVVLGSGYLGPARERRFGPGEITDVRTKIGMQSGESAYYDLVMVRADGKKVTAGRGIRDKREAEWLAATLRASLTR
ncbi:MAG TPA: hypothetical protein VEB59_15210 [Gemmatimonadales bacterium]|nr:hypothetical protein [Gemmatimonadales bacterium]